MNHTNKKKIKFTINKKKTHTHTYTKYKILIQWIIKWSMNYTKYTNQKNSIRNNKKKQPEIGMKHGSGIYSTWFMKMKNHR